MTIQIALGHLEAAIDRLAAHCAHDATELARCREVGQALCDASEDAYDLLTRIYATTGNTEVCLWVSKLLWAIQQWNGLDVGRHEVHAAEPAAQEVVSAEGTKPDGGIISGASCAHCGTPCTEVCRGVWPVGTPLNRSV